MWISLDFLLLDYFWRWDGDKIPFHQVLLDWWFSTQVVESSEPSRQVKIGIPRMDPRSRLALRRRELGKILSIKEIEWDRFSSSGRGMNVNILHPLVTCRWISTFPHSIWIGWNHSNELTEGQSIPNDFLLCRQGLWATERLLFASLFSGYMRRTGDLERDSDSWQKMEAGWNLLLTSWLGNSELP